MQTKLKQVMFLALCGLGAPAAADWVRQGEADVQFEAKTNIGIQVTGKTQELALEEKEGLVLLTVPLNTVKTGMDMRDSHMRESLEVDKFPNAQLAIPLTSLQLPESGKQSEGSVQGDMTLHGKTLKVPVNYKLSSEGSTLKVQAQVPLRYTDFGIPVVSRVGAKVKDDLVIKASFQAQRK